MNERIKQLAKQQAGAILMDLVMPDSGMPERVKWNVGITTENLEELAELIVKECMNTIAESREVRQTAYYYRNRIAEHFGVDE